jgi:hypothetical protein
MPGHRSHEGGRRLRYLHERLACVDTASRSKTGVFPWSCNGSGWVITSSPDAQSVTMLPTAATRPAASTPSAVGGRRPTSQPPVRTNSSQAPHARRPDLNQHLVPASGRGPGTSIIPTSPPVRRIPAASIWCLRVDCDGRPTFDRLEDFAGRRSSSFVDQRGGCRCDVRGINAGGGQ